MTVSARPVTGFNDPNQQRRDRETLNKITSFQFDDSRVRTSAEVLAGVTPVNFGYRPGLLKRWASGNGSSDDTDAIQAAIDTGLPIDDYGDATYRITQKLIVPAGQFTQFRGKIRLRPDLNGAGSLYAFDLATIQTAGQAQSVFATASARQGARTIVVNDVTGMSVGDRLVIRTDVLWDYNNDGVLYKGETNRILSINAGTKTITLQTPLNCEYNHSLDNIYVETYTPNLVDIDGIEIDFGTIGTQGGGLGLSGLVDSKIRNVTMRNCGLVGISLVECYNVEISNATVTDGYLSGLGYGIQANGSSKVNIIGGLLRNNRHGVDFSGAIPCHECLVTGANIIGNTAEGSGAGSHGGGNRIAYIGNNISNCLVGIQSRSPNTYVLNNTYHSCASFALQFGAPGLVVRGNQQVVNSTEPVVGVNQLADNFFLELGATSVDNDLFDVNQPNAEMIVEDNTCQPTDDFIVLQSGVTKMRRLTVRGNNVNFQGSAHKLINAAATTGTTIEGATTILSPNTLRSSAGTITIFSNASITNAADFVNDTTPSVLSPSHGQFFYMQNTSPTTVTAFDDGTPGQEIILYVKDSQTTIDFTGTTLRGNNGADFAPANPFMLKAKYDGAQWYCTVDRVA